jgi:hypothetical protein
MLRIYKFLSGVNAFLIKYFAIVLGKTAVVFFCPYKKAMPDN